MAVQELLTIPREPKLAERIREAGILPVSKKFVYLFSEGNGSMRELLGGKGANLAEMTSLGMPVPRGFTITTEACTKFFTGNVFLILFFYSC